MRQKLTPKYVENVCRLGKGDVCSFLVLENGTWSCVKGTSKEHEVNVSCVNCLDGADGSVGLVFKDGDFS
jgi:hypothetical protein